MSEEERNALAIDTKGRFGKFLRTKRATLTPDRFDLPVFRRRRVAGLRREEIAQLAGISPAWYAQLEAGANVAVSPALVRRLADILALSALERAYFFSLAFDELGAVDTVVPELQLLAGSRIAAESFEAEIELALRAHRSLKVQVYSALVHGTVEELLPQLDEARCPIGVWLHDDLAHEHRCGTHYSQASRVHAAFHHEIDRVVDAGLADAPSAVERLIVAPGSYVTTSVALERTFSTWALARS
jgi:transcriptional regulator with XRE-family HTH domain